MGSPSGDIDIDAELPIYLEHWRFKCPNCLSAPEHPKPRD